MHHYEVHLCGMKGDTLADRSEPEYYDVYVRKYSSEDEWDVTEEHEDIMNHCYAWQLAEQLAAKYGCDIDEY